MISRTGIYEMNVLKALENKIFSQTVLSCCRYLYIIYHNL